MASVDDLDNLDNKALRAKCMEYGLPNVPITDTSRKILIKKLKAAMAGETGGTGSKANKARRETINVAATSTKTTSASSDKEEKGRQSNRRQTIAAVPKEKNEPISATNKRRSSRTTPVPEAISSIPILSSKKIPVVIEETDFDEEFILVEDDIAEPVVTSRKQPSYTSYQPTITNIPIRNKSKSPSLSKSIVVTTSYNKDTFDKNEKIVEEEEETEEEGYVEKRKEYNLSTQYNVNRDKDTLTSPRYSTPTLSRLSTEKESIYPTGYKPLYPTLNIGNPLGAEKENLTTKSVYESSSTITKRYTQDGKGTPSSLLSRTSRPLEEIPSLRHSKINRYVVENSDSNPDEEEDEEDDDIVQKAPYLSDFARRLSTLKAEKLDCGLRKDVFATPTGDNYLKTTGRRTYVSTSRKGGVRESFHQLWLALNQKYRLKTFFFIVILLTLIILFAYYYYLAQN